MSFAATQLDLGLIILSEVSQKKKDKYHMISIYMCNLKYDTNELIYKIETYSQAQETNLWLLKGKRWGTDKLGVWDQQIQTTVYKIHKEQIPAYSTGKCTQYLIMNRNEIEHEKEYIYEFIYINESLSYNQRPTHCKSVILQ